MIQSQAVKKGSQDITINVTFEDTPDQGVIDSCNLMVSLDETVDRITDFYLEILSKTGKIQFGDEAIESPGKSTFGDVKAVDGSSFVVKRDQDMEKELGLAEPEQEVKLFIRRGHVNQGFDPVRIGSRFNMEELAASNNMILLKTEGSYEKSSAIYGDGGFPLPK